MGGDDLFQHLDSVFDNAGKFIEQVIRLPPVFGERVLHLFTGFSNETRYARGCTPLRAGRTAA